MWGVVLLTMLVYNLPHATFSEDTRFQHTREAVAEMIATSSAEDSALFNDMVGDIRWEMSLDEDGESLSDNDIWNMIPTMECFQKKGCRVNANRCMGWVKQSTKDAPQWTMRKLVYTYIAIEADMLAGKNLRTLAAKPVELGAADGTTAVGEAAGGEKVLRAACQNTLVMAVLILGDAMNRFRVRAMVALTKPFLRHFEQQSHELRSAVVAMEWQGRQVQGEVFCVISGACTVLTSARVHLGGGGWEGRVVGALVQGSARSILQQDNLVVGRLAEQNGGGIAAGAPAVPSSQRVQGELGRLPGVGGALRSAAGPEMVGPVAVPQGHEHSVGRVFVRLQLGGAGRLHRALASAAPASDVEPNRRGRHLQGQERGQKGGQLQVLAAEEGYGLVLRPPSARRGAQLQGDRRRPTSFAGDGQVARPDLPPPVAPGRPLAQEDR